MDCLFCAIADGKIPSKKIYEDDFMLAFYDIAPQAPVHLLVIPKTHTDSFDAINENSIDSIGKIILKIPEIARLAGIENGYRVISNCGEDAGQTVKHLHFHILGGAPLPLQLGL